jgi:hypothetical protein
VFKHLPSKYKALDLIPSTWKENISFFSLPHLSHVTKERMPKVLRHYQGMELW